MMMMTMMNSDGLDSSTNTKMSKAEPGVAQTITCSTESVMNVKDLVENEEMFRSQFDRESETYHGGDERQVDIGGDQVPEGMDGEEVIQPSGPVVLTYGKKHDDVVAFRAKLGDVKKAMSDVILKVDAVAKMLRSIAKGIPEEKKEKAEKVLAARQAKLEASCEELRAFKEEISDEKYAEDYADMIEDVVEASLNRFPMSQQNFFDYSLEVKVHQTKIVRDQKDLLADIKAIKKEVEEAVANGEMPEGVTVEE
eukprot:TRINITY_DN864_c0_g1_i2.p3 TRINITY_DN864_c0_g1~~TRINITY_DN864_c0_g1_i2.p3  ORF type:complete len:253 (+),score=100.51 TRINITY_DN864_c0_g1_i2:199-957(+)